VEGSGRGLLRQNLPERTESHEYSLPGGPVTRPGSETRTSYRRGFGLENGFIDQLYTRLVSTSNYSATANLHNSQITTAPAKPLSSLSSPAVPWQRPLTVQILQLHELKSSLHRLPYRTKLEPCPLFITSRHGPHRKHTSSIVAFGSVAAGTCLSSRCPETALVYPPISWSLQSNGSTRHNIIILW
jgi:hypothetical protein